MDCVLTDLGRERIARNDGSFEVVRYAFGDDGIDYSLFVANTGSLQQDINILNTPILEANVNEKVALKYPLITISNPDLKYLPVLQATSTTVALGERTDSQIGKSLQFKQKMITTGKNVPSEIVDASFKVELNADLLFIDRATPVSISPYGTASYILVRSGTGADQGAQVVFNVAVQSLTSNLWDTLGTGTKGSRTISTTIRCRGVISGLTEEITATISEEFGR